MRVQQRQTSNLVRSYKMTKPIYEVREATEEELEYGDVIEEDEE